MRWNMMVLMSCLAMTGCMGSSSSERQDENIQSSLQYDTVPCGQLLAQRNALAQQYNLSTDAKAPAFSNPAMGLGPFTPDVRSKNKRDSDLASGKIDAMNRSMERRECGKPDKQKKFALPS